MIQTRKKENAVARIICRSLFLKRQKKMLNEQSVKIIRLENKEH